MGEPEKPYRTVDDISVDRMSLEDAVTALSVLSDGDHSAKDIISNHPELGQAVLSYLSIVGDIMKTTPRPPRTLLFNGKPSGVESKSSRFRPTRVKSFKSDSLIISIRNGKPVGTYREKG